MTTLNIRVYIFLVAQAPKAKLWDCMGNGNFQVEIFSCNLMSACSNIKYYLNVESTTVVFKLVERNGPEPHMSSLVRRDELKSNIETTSEPMGSAVQGG